MNSKKYFKKNSKKYTLDWWQEQACGGKWESLIICEKYKSKKFGLQTQMKNPTANIKILISADYIAPDDDNS